MALVRREDKVAYIGVTSGETVKNYRMRNFTDMSISKNPVEYSRRYVDESAERTDVTGYSDSISYGFDQDTENEAHKAIIAISDNEMTGDSACVDIIIVDMTQEITATPGSYKTKKRRFTVVPDSEGDSSDAYTYSGTLKANGKTVWGKATTADEWKTCTFTADA
ncbi:MAG: hypothetical protein RR205_04535 [Oscillospiraceae bacterium]